MPPSRGHPELGIQRYSCLGHGALFDVGLVLSQAYGRVRIGLIGGLGSVATACREGPGGTAAAHEACALTRLEKELVVSQVGVTLVGPDVDHAEGVCRRNVPRGILGRLVVGAGTFAARSSIGSGGRRCDAGGHPDSHQHLLLAIGEFHSLHVLCEQIYDLRRVEAESVRNDFRRIAPHVDDDAAVTFRKPVRPIVAHVAESVFGRIGDPFELSTVRKVALPDAPKSMCHYDLTGSYDVGNGWDTAVRIEVNVLGSPPANFDALWASRGYLGECAHLVEPADGAWHRRLVLLVGARSGRLGGRRSDGRGGGSRGASVGAVRVGGRARKVGDNPASTDHHGHRQNDGGDSDPSLGQGVFLRN